MLRARQANHEHPLQLVSFLAYEQQFARATHIAPGWWRKLLFRISRLASSLVLQEEDGYNSPPDSPVGRAPIAPLPTLDGGSPMTPRKARACGLLGPLPGRVAVATGGPLTSLVRSS